jgi:hypothetical protein
MYGDGARPATTVPTTLSAMAPPVAPAAPSVVPAVVPAVVAPAVAEPSRKTLHVHTTRRCAYRKWAPDIAAKCECWRCVAAREYARCFAPGGPRVIIIKAEPAKEPAKEPARDAAA